MTITSFRPTPFFPCIQAKPRSLLHFEYNFKCLNCIYFSRQTVVVFVADPLIFPDSERRTRFVGILFPIVLFGAIAYFVVRKEPGIFRPSASVSVAERPRTGLELFWVGQLETPSKQSHAEYYLTGIGTLVQPKLHHMILETKNIG